MSSPRLEPQPPPRERADITDVTDLFKGPTHVGSLASTGLLLLGVFYTLYFARSFLLPIVLAVLMSLVFSPIVRWMKRRGVPSALGAALVLVSFLAALSFGVYRLAEPATAWILTAPESVRRLEYKVLVLRKPLEQIATMADRVQHLVSVDDGRPIQGVEIKNQGSRFVNQAHDFVGAALVMFVLLYFILASEDLFLRKVVRVLPRFTEKKLALEIARQVEEHIATYLLSVTLINAGLGVAVGLAMFLIGMPNPVLWGTMAWVFNYVPYVGPLAGSIVLALVGVISFDHLGWALVPPAVYLTLHAIEANLVTPALLGKRLDLNPVVIFVAITFWFWLWGIAGALLAVPMLVALKIFCEQIEPLGAIGEFLGS